jgi:four helix bundle protein
MQTTYRATALELMMELLPALKRLIDRIRKHDKNLADQVRRAATSVVLNLAEADGNVGGHRRSRLHTAHGSLREVRCGLKVAAAWEYVTAPGDRDARHGARSGRRDDVAANSTRGMSAAHPARAQGPKAGWSPSSRGAGAGAGAVTGARGRCRGPGPGP